MGRTVAIVLRTNEASETSGFRTLIAQSVIGRSNPGGQFTMGAFGATDGLRITLLTNGPTARYTI